MSRTVPTAILTALTQYVVEPFYAVEIDLDSGPLRLWTGYGNRTIDGQTYVGGGSLVSVDSLEEVADLSAKSVTLSLSGMDSSVISAALEEPFQRRRVRILWGVTGVSDFVEVFAGSLNQMTIEDGPDGGTVSVSVDSRLVELERSANRRYTSESHKTRYSTDTFFDFVAELQDKKITFEAR